MSSALAGTKVKINHRLTAWVELKNPPITLSKQDAKTAPAPRDLSVFLLAAVGKSSVSQTAINPEVINYLPAWSWR